MANLQKAVIKQLGVSKSELKGVCSDISNHGIDGGFGGFIYYTDTVKFFDKNKKAIMALAGEMASEFGTGKYEMIAGFGCLKSSKLSVDEVVEALSGDTDDTQHVKNALAWFAAESVARDIAES